MIASLSGTVLDVAAASVVLDVGGVGFHVLCAPPTAARCAVGEQAQLFTHLAVREDALTLYGFASASDREAFRLVQTASGVGPKLALAILAVLDSHELGQAIATSNLAALMRVPGVGRKVAERLVVELKDKVTLLAALTSDDAAETAAPAVDEWRRSQVVEGLTGLGYSAREAERAVAAVAEEWASQQATTAGETVGAVVGATAGDVAKPTGQRSGARVTETEKTPGPAESAATATTPEPSVAEYMRAALKRLAR